MTVRSKQLAATGPVGAVDTTVYTCPDGFRTIVKCVVVYNNASAAARATVYLYDGATLKGLFNMQLTAQGTDGDTVILLPWLVMNAGQSLHVYATQSSSYFLISGTELLL